MATDARAFTKCEIDGKVVYQNAPCSIETIDQSDKNKERNEALHKRLDQLQAKGVGWVERATAKYVAPVEDESASSREHRFVPTTRAEIWARRDQQFEEIARKTERQNQENAEKLTSIFDEAKRRCGGKLLDYPEIGMTDEEFRNCTIHARTGGVIQIVVDTYESIPLRLYVFSTSRAQRVYSINGVITAIKP